MPVISKLCKQIFIYRCHITTFAQNRKWEKEKEYIGIILPFDLKLTLEFTLRYIYVAIRKLLANYPVTAQWSF